MLENNIEAIINIFILLLLLGSAFAVVFSKNLLNAVIYLTFFGVIMSIAYLSMNAPDVAITEAAIGAGIVTFLFLLVICTTGEEQKPHKLNMISVISLILIAVALFFAVLGMPAYGDANAVATTGMAKYFIENSYDDIGIPNAVTSVLASYRAFDTMGEVFVIFAAGIAVAMLVGSEFLFGKKKKEQKKGQLNKVDKATKKESP